MKPATRVFMNTGFLYGKMIITIIISLYSTRLVLSALGVADYGIFNLIGGVIAMLAFLNSAMAISTQRYISFYLGADDIDKLKSIFNSSVIIHLIIGLTVVVLLEIGGIFLFKGFLNIPPDRLGPSKVIFHFMVLSVFFTINAVPYYAAINAHENMLFDAIAGIVESSGKLGIAIIVLNAGVDKLILYGVMIAGLTVLMRFIVSIYSRWRYEECRFRFHIDIPLLKELFSFAGWNLFGSFCSVLRNEGLAIVLNIFFSVVVNAAYGIANQVNGQISAFSSNMIRALYPQIVKSEGGQDRVRMLRLSAFGSRFAFLLFSFFAIPLIIEMPFILKIWLKTIPPDTVIFCRLVLGLSLLQQISIGLMAAITSVGKIKLYQVTVGLLLIFNLPVAVVLIKIGLPSYSVLFGSLTIELFALASRIWIAYKIVGLNMADFLRKVVINSFLIFILVAFLSFSPHYFLSEGYLRAFLTIVISVISLIILSPLLAFTSEENQKIKLMLLNFIRKLKTEKK